MQGKVRLALVVASLSLATAAASQSILDDIEAQLGGRVGEFERVEQLLSDPDPNRSAAAMELLLASGDPAFVRKAREFGLFSSDPNIRQLALKAILDAGGAFRLSIDPPGEDSTDVYRAISMHGGSIDGEGGSAIPFLLKPGFNQSAVCWVDARDGCVLRPTGETVHLTEWRASGVTVTGEFALDESGSLVGHILVSNRGAPVRARIPLID